MPIDSFRCRLVTPAESLLDEPVRYANVPAWDGLMGIQPGRAPVVVQLGTGELTLSFPQTTHAGGDRRFFIDRGFAQMSGGELIILAESAIPAEKITESEAKAELLEADLATIPADARDKAAAADQIRRRQNIARLKARIARNSRERGI